MGVRAGGTVQSVLMVFKIVAIAALVAVGTLIVRGRIAWTPILDQHPSPGLLISFGAAMVPVAFAYGGWQTATFAAGEMKSPRRDLPRALILGMIGVTLLYAAVNYAYLHALGVAGLANTQTPATSVMRLALGEKGATMIALAIAISTLGFLSQSVLTAPRVYFAMAQDGLFFRWLAWVHPRTQVPVFAIILQSAWTMVIMVSGSYDKILNYVISMDATFWMLTAACIFIMRRRSPAKSAFAMPGHPYTTALFCIACGALVINTIYQFPSNSLIGVGILLTGVPLYYIWKRTSRA